MKTFNCNKWIWVALAGATLSVAAPRFWFDSHSGLELISMETGQTLTNRSTAVETPLKIKAPVQGGEILRLDKEVEIQLLAESEVDLYEMQLGYALYFRHGGLTVKSEATFFEIYLPNDKLMASGNPLVFSVTQTSKGEIYVEVESGELKFYHSVEKVFKTLSVGDHMWFNQLKGDLQ